MTCLEQPDGWDGDDRRVTSSVFWPPTACTARVLEAVSTVSITHRVGMQQIVGLRRNHRQDTLQRLVGVERRHHIPHAFGNSVSSLQSDMGLSKRLRALSDQRLQVLLTLSAAAAEARIADC